MRSIDVVDIYNCHDTEGKDYNDDSAENSYCQTGKCQLIQLITHI